MPSSSLPKRNTRSFGISASQIVVVAVIALDADERPAVDLLEELLVGALDHVLVLAHAHRGALVIGLGPDEEDLLHEERVGDADDRADVERVLRADDRDRHVAPHRVELGADRVRRHPERRDAS